MFIFALFSATPGIHDSESDAGLLVCSRKGRFAPEAAPMERCRPAIIVNAVLLSTGAPKKASTLTYWIKVTVRGNRFLAEFRRATRVSDDLYGSKHSVRPLCKIRGRTVATCC